MYLNELLKKYTKRDLLYLAKTHKFMFYDRNGAVDLMDLPEGETALAGAKKIYGAYWDEDEEYWTEKDPAFCEMKDEEGNTASVRIATLAELKELDGHINFFCGALDWPEAAWEGLKAMDTEEGFRIWRLYQLCKGGVELKRVFSTISRDTVSSVRKFARKALYGSLEFKEYDSYASDPEADWICVYNMYFGYSFIEEDLA
ncbi:MAG: hypothetical protein IJV70_07150 [Clostridia bacterium]|nr:hypothetical protein [Clostridia bacterium]